MVGLAHYDASKHGVWGFTKNIALELAAYGITVNAVAPGGILTPGTGIADMKEAIEAFQALIPMSAWATRTTSREPRCSSPPTSPAT